MPYKRKGKCVYKKSPNGNLSKVGCSKSEDKAKSYLKKLYSVEDNEERLETFEEYCQRLNTLVEHQNQIPSG